MKWFKDVDTHEQEMHRLLDTGSVAVQVYRLPNTGYMYLYRNSYQIHNSRTFIHSRVALLMFTPNSQILTKIFELFIHFYSPK